MLECQSCVRRVGFAAPDDGEMAGPFPDKPLGGCKAEPATAPGDEVARHRRKLQLGFGSVRDDRGTINPVHRHNNLADMPRVLHAAERLGGSHDREHSIRQRDKDAPIEERGKLGEELAGESWTINQQPININPKELDIIAERLQSDFAVGEEITLSKLDETPVRPKYRKAFVDRLAGDRVQDNVDALAIGNLTDVIGESERPRVDDVMCPETDQKLALFH